MVTKTESTQRRRAWHQGRLDAAPDDRKRFWVACNLLAAVARRSGRLPEVKDAVLAMARKIEKGEPL